MPLPPSARQAWAGAVPCLTKVWLVSSRISQPSMIMRSMARFFRMFSVSLTSSCIILWGQEVTRQRWAATMPRRTAGGCPGLGESLVPKETGDPVSEKMSRRLTAEKQVSGL